MYESAEEREALFDFTGKYTEIELLNKRATGFGWAVLVKDNFESQRIKVVKLPNSESATRELLVEAEILTKISQYLRHRNLIELTSVDKYRIQWNGKKEDRWFLVLQFGGQNLRGRLGKLGLKHDKTYAYLQGRPLALEHVIDIGIQVTEGLRALHEFEESPGQHIIHRDIKPENILIDDDGVARLADFGISKIVERITQSVTAAGTPPYLAPEYSRGRLHAGSDIYSLGIVLYEMATGTFPFRTMQDRFYEMPAPPHEVNPDVPAALSDAIQRCLWWDPKADRGEEEAQRYQRAAELLDDLKRCFRRLYPLPPRFGKAESRDGQKLYRDTETDQDVHVHVYPAERPGVCVSRLSAVRQQIPNVRTPVHVFDNEDTVGVVVAQRSELRWGSQQAELTSGEAVHRFVVDDAVKLAQQIDAMHRFGVYHGFLAPQHVCRHHDQWWIDGVWLGSLVGLVDADAILKDRADLPGFLAPEVLGWTSPPTLSADIYGLGAMLFGWLTGEPPIDPESARQAAHSFRATLGVRDRAPLVSRNLEGIIVKALQPEPMNRHRSMDELIGALQQCRWPQDIVETFVDDARQAQKQNRLLDAYEQLDNALLLDPGNPLVHHVRAEIFFLEGESKWALQENQRSLEIDPNSSVLFLHGRCLAAMERHDEAIDYYQRGLDLDDCSGGRHLLARSLERIGKEERAIEEYQRAAEIAESSGNALEIQEIQADLSALLEKRKG